MLTPPRRLSRHLEPPLDDARLNRMWRNVLSRRASPRPAWLVPSMATAALAALLAVGLVRSHGAVRPLAGTLIDVDERETVTAYDGIRLRLHPATRLRWDRTDADRIEATLERGEVDLDVPHEPGRMFAIHAGDFDILDRGTRFMVTVMGGRVSVSVTSGTVEVRRRGATESGRSLGAGESWASALPAEVAADAPSSAPREPIPEVDAPSPPLAAPTTSAAHSLVVPPSAPLTTRPVPSARELLETANAARLAGRPRDAAAAFDALRRHYRTDPRAGLAACELGRLRLDAFGDPKLAVEAFDDAIALAPDAPFREDAEARLVEALDGMHSPRCATEKAAYFARYSSGLHAAAVGARCLR
jgi:hypothetical protein